jgi:hypothetical protein
MPWCSFVLLSLLMRFAVSERGERSKQTGAQVIAKVSNRVLSTIETQCLPSGAVPVRNAFQ